MKVNWLNFKIGCISIDNWVQIKKIDEINNKKKQLEITVSRSTIIDKHEYWFNEIGYSLNGFMISSRVKLDWLPLDQRSVVEKNANGHIFSYNKPLMMLIGKEVCKHSSWWLGWQSLNWPLMIFLRTRILFSNLGNWKFKGLFKTLCNFAS